MTAPVFHPTIWNRFSSVFTPNVPARISAAIPVWVFPLPARSSKARAGASMRRTARPITARARARAWWWNCRWRRCMPEINIHASCVAIGKAGVLLLGKSGAGKSDLALRLIDQGAVLVADDRTLVWVEKDALHARAPSTIKGLLEIRGLGIVTMPVRAKARIALVVRLGPEGARLPAPRFWRPPAQLKPRV